MRRPILDLHGIKHEDVPSKVHSFVWENRKYKDALYIITGYSLIMKKRVLDVIHLYSTRRVEDSDGSNWGRIKVWLDN